MQRAKDRFRDDLRSHDEALERAEMIRGLDEAIDRAPDSDHAFAPSRLPNPFADLFDPID